MRQPNYAIITDFLKEHESFLILSHVNPDGDAIGSSLATVSFLRSFGKRADAFFAEEPPPRYKFMFDKTLLIQDTLNLEKYDAIICLDSGTPSRIALPNELTFDKIDLPSLNIDHHPDNSYYADINLVEPSSASVADILMNVFCSMRKHTIPAFSATCLFAALVADTGGFRFDNAGKDAFETAAKLAALGADCRTVMNSFYFSTPLKRLKFEAEMILEKLKTSCGGAYSWLLLEEEILQKYDMQRKEAETLIDIVKSIEGVKIAAVFYKTNDGIKFSLRSKDKKLSVAKIARALGGGGHELAAGGIIQTNSFENAEQILLKAVSEMIKDIK